MIWRACCRFVVAFLFFSATLFHWIIWSTCAIRSVLLNEFSLNLFVSFSCQNKHQSNYNQIYQRLEVRAWVFISFLISMWAFFVITLVIECINHLFFGRHKFWQIDNFIACPPNDPYIFLSIMHCSINLPR